jgi:DNA transposition AAA+ family ATPase
MASRTAMLTPGVTTTPRDLEIQLLNRCLALNADIARTLRPDVNLELSREPVVGLELLIIDEADRMKTAGLEMVRDYFDRGDVGIVLIGMPGFERRLARYPQLYSRVGFAHQYRPLDSTDVPQVLARYWEELGFSYDSHRPSDAESVVTIVRITGGNFRLIERLMSQVARIMKINKLDTITPDAIEAAREVLVVGA